jgi:hypothetical protein
LFLHPNFGNDVVHETLAKKNSIHVTLLLEVLENPEGFLPFKKLLE